MPPPLRVLSGFRYTRNTQSTIEVDDVLPTVVNWLHWC